MHFLKRAILVMGLAFCAGPVVAQGVTVSPLGTGVLTVESDRMFAESLFGQRVAREIEAEQSVLLAENRRIEAQLTAEEKELTERRKTMEPAAFRAVAEAFDARVSLIREEQDAKSREISTRREREQAVFVQAANQVLGELMRDTGAVVILEWRTVLISNRSVDVTQEAIRRLDASIGDGLSVAEPQD